MHRSVCKLVLVVSLTCFFDFLKIGYVSFVLYHTLGVLYHTAVFPPSVFPFPLPIFHISLYVVLL